MQTSVLKSCGLLAILALAWAVPAHAYGPGVHLRECLAAAELLKSKGHPLAALVSGPEFRPWLRLGCIAPDFRAAVPSLKGVATHDRAFVRGTVVAPQLSPAPPQATAFAFGALVHIASDGGEALMDALMTVVGRAGATDLVPGFFDGPDAENETWVELIGDLQNGNGADLVALLGHLGAIEGQPIAWQPVIAWYGERLAQAFPGSGVEPQKLVAELQAVVAKIKDKLAPFEPTMLVDLLAAQKGQPPWTSLKLFASVGGGMALSAFGVDVPAQFDPLRFERAKNLPFFKDAQLWQSTYDQHIQGLGPQWALDFLAGAGVDPAFPAWNGKGVQAAIRQSLHDNAESALAFDEVLWTDAAGKVITAWQPGQGPVTCKVRLFAMKETEATVALDIYALPQAVGTDLGVPLASAVTGVALKPMNYVALQQRPWIQATADPTQWVGKTRGLVMALSHAELATDSGKQPPFVHGDWRRYQAFADADVFGTGYDPHAHTFGGFPPGLALPKPAWTTGNLIVRVVHGGTGSPVWGVKSARFTMGGLDLGQANLEGARRIVKNGLPAGPVTVTLEGYSKDAAGTVPAVGVVTVLPGETTVTTLAVWPIPAPAAVDSADTTTASPDSAAPLDSGDTTTDAPEVPADTSPPSKKAAPASDSGCIARPVARPPTWLLALVAGIWFARGRKARASAVMSD